LGLGNRIFRFNTTKDALADIYKLFRPSRFSAKVGEQRSEDLGGKVFPSIIFRVYTKLEITSKLLVKMVRRKKYLTENEGNHVTTRGSKCKTAASGTRNEK
jgi:hypothetical protein